MPILRGINKKFKEITIHRRCRGNIQKLKKILEKEGKSKPQGSDTSDLVYIVDKEGNDLRDNCIFQLKELNLSKVKPNEDSSFIKKNGNVQYKPFTSSREFCK